MSRQDSEPRKRKVTEKGQSIANIFKRPCTNDQKSSEPSSSITEQTQPTQISSPAARTGSQLLSTSTPCASISLAAGSIPDLQQATIEEVLDDSEALIEIEEDFDEPDVNKESAKNKLYK